MLHNKKSFMMLMSFCFILLMSCSLFFSFTYAKGLDEKPHKAYATISIEIHDTLWGIAKEHMNNEYYTITDYIDEVKRINNLSNDTILAGDSLILPIVK